MAELGDIERLMFGLEQDMEAADAGFDAAVEEYGRLGKAAAEAEMAWEVANARAMLTINESEWRSKQGALLTLLEDGRMVAELKRDWKIAAHLVLTQKEALISMSRKKGTLSAKHETQRSRGANERTRLGLDSIPFRP